MPNSAEHILTHEPVCNRYSDVSMRDSLHIELSGQDPIVVLFEQISRDVKMCRKLRMAGAAHGDYAYSEHSAAIAGLLEDVAQSPRQAASNTDRLAEGGERKGKYSQEAGFVGRVAASIRQAALFAFR